MLNIPIAKKPKTPQRSELLWGVWYITKNINFPLIF